jgi:hypothetical protein
MIRNQKGLRFNDGMVINTQGSLRVTRKADGYYVVGRGMMVPVSSWKEGKELIEKMTKK